jgi:acetyl esterase/lipase
MSSEVMQKAVENMRAFKNLLDKSKGSVDRRKAADDRAAREPFVPGITLEEDSLSGVEVLRAIPENAANDCVVLYIHGGAFMTGNSKTSRYYISCIAGETGITAYGLSYRLAPEHPYPAAPDDCFGVYKKLLEKYPGTKIVLVGGSAGGALCLVTVIRAIKSGIKPPMALVLNSPVTNMDNIYASRKNNDEKDCMLSYDVVVKSGAAYIPKGADLSNPDISPIHADYTGFPPIKIVVDSSEVFLDDSVYLAEKAKKAGVMVDLRITEGCFHGFPVAGYQMPESAEDLKNTAAFIRGSRMLPEGG